MAQAAMNTPMPTSIKLDMDTKTRLQRLATSRQRSTHWLMQEAIRQYLEREEQLAQFRDEMQTAWDDYQDTGLHVTGKEVFAWMETWFTDSEAPTPKCHH